MMTRPATALARRSPATALAVACAIVPLAGPAWADGAAAERLYRIEALGHAGAIEDAYRALETHIRETSTAPTGPAAWPGDGLTPVAPWRQRWTARGLAARYCEDVLLVYADAQALKGVGLDHDSVRIAPRTYGPELGQLARPPLHRIENQLLHGGEGRPALVLPACLHGASFGALPNDRVALAGLVPDPLAAHNRITRRSREWSTVDCPAGLRGPGRTLTREVLQDHDGHGTPVDAPVPGPWEVFVDHCRPLDDAMPPLPEPGEDPTAADPVVTHSVRVERRELDCPAGQTGSIRETRRIEVTTTRFPWDTVPVVRERVGDWQLEGDDCRPIPVEDERDDCGWRESGYGEDWSIVYTCGGGGGGGGGDGGEQGGDQDGSEDGSDDTGGPGEGSDQGPGGADNASGGDNGADGGGGDGDGGGDGGGGGGGGEG